MISTWNARTAGRSILATVVLALIGPVMLCAGVVYVDDDAPLGGDGQTWQTAFRYLQDGLADASASDVVRIAQGVYRPDQDEDGDVTPGDRTASFALSSGLGVYGGYRGAYDGSGLPADDRDVAGFVTKLDGDLAGDDQPGFVNNDENSYHVLVAYNVDDTAVLDGVTVTGGNANDDGIPHDAGGGMRISAGRPNLEGCTFTGNAAHWGGGLEMHSSSAPLVSDCQFIGNSAEHGGGANVNTSGLFDAMFMGCEFIENQATRDGGGTNNWADCHPTYVNCRFERNTSENGGGMTLWGNDDTTVTGCEFIENTTTAQGAGVYVEDGTPELLYCTFTQNETPNHDGGGVAVYWGSPTLSHCTFTENHASRGGAVQCGWYAGVTILDCTFTANSSEDRGGALQFYSPSPLTLRGSTFDGNQAASGGAVDAIEGPLEITDCDFFNNRSNYDGGALNTFGEAVPTVTGCTFTGNFAGTVGGGMSLWETTSGTLTDCTFGGNDAQQVGGGIFVCRATGVTITDCSFDDNEARDYDGGGLYNDQESDVALDGCTFTANVAARYGGGLHSNEDVTGFAANDCTFTDNHAVRGGGVCNEGPSFSLTNCVLKQNVATERGGGADVDHCAARFSGCTFLGNNSVLGGGVGAYFGSVEAAGCTFVGNTATSNGGGGYYHHGTFVFADCVWAGNAANGHGGGVHVYSYCDVWVTRCWFSGNVAGSHGGGVHTSNGTKCWITNCGLVGNVAGDYAGGAGWANSAGSLVNSLVAGNVAQNSAGGGVACRYTSSPVLASCTLSGNSAPAGGGLHCFASNPVVKNGIFWNDATDEINIASGSPVISYCTVEGGWPGVGNLAADPLFAPGASGTWTAIGAYNSETGYVVLRDATAAWTPNTLVGCMVRPDTTQTGQFLIVANTATTMTIYADWATCNSGTSWVAAGMSYEVYDYRLAAGSPCIDSGDNTDPPRDTLDLDGDLCHTDAVPVDLRGMCRYYDDAGTPDTGFGTSPLVDRGAYEFDAGSEVPPGPCPGDLNCDGAVDNFDISPFVLALTNPAGHASQYPGCDILTADTNNDGAVDNFDISAFVDLLTGG